MHIDYDFELNYLRHQVLVKNLLDIVSTAITTAMAIYMNTTTTQTTKP